MCLLPCFSHLLVSNLRFVAFHFRGHLLLIILSIHLVFRAVQAAHIPRSRSWASRAMHNRLHLLLDPRYYRPSLFVGELPLPLASSPCRLHLCSRCMLDGPGLCALSRTLPVGFAPRCCLWTRTRPGVWLRYCARNPSYQGSNLILPDIPEVMPSMVALLVQTDGKQEVLLELAGARRSDPSLL